jgi:plasmid stabilization system protein ParE
MYRLIILPLAKKDVKEAADWYNSKQAGLGKRFVSNVRRKINIVKNNPFIYATRYDDVKTAVLDVFPFMIHYTIDEIEEIIIISAILHTSRNPDIWKSEGR